MHRFLSACLVCLCFSIFPGSKTVAQTWVMADTAKARALVDQFFKQGLKKKSAENDLRIDTARTILTALNLRESLLYADLLYFESCYSSVLNANWEKNLSTIKQCLEIRRKHGATELPSGVLALNQLGLVYFYLGKFSESESAYLEAEKTLLRLPSAEKRIWVALYSNFGSLYRENGFVEKSLELYQKAVDHELAGGTSTWKVALTYENMADAYQKLGDFRKMLEYFLKSVETRIRADGTDKKMSTADVYAQVSLAHNFLGNQAEAFDYLSKNSQIVRELAGDSSAALAKSYLLMGSLLSDQGKNDSAIIYYKHSLALREKNYGKNSNEAAVAWTNLGIACTQKTDLDTAIYFFQKALSIREKLYGPKSPKVTFTMGWMLYPLIESGKFDLALSNLRKMEAAVDYKADAQIADLPNPKATAEMLSAAVALYQRWFKHTNDSAKLDTAIVVGERGMEAFLISLATMSTDDAKAALYKKFEGFFGNLALCYADKYNQTGDPVFQEKLFKLLNRTIGQNFLKASHTPSALTAGGIPAEWIEKERRASLQMVELENESLNLLAAGKTRQDTTWIALSLRLERAKQDYGALQAEMETRFPNYARLRHASDSVSLADFRKKVLAENQCLVSFLKTTHCFLAVVVAKGNIQAIELPAVSTYSEDTKAFLEGIAGFHTAASPDDLKYPQLLEKYNLAAQQLYQKLIAPLEKLLSERVIIISSESMAGIPFEALLSGKPTKTGDFSTYPFLVKKYAFSYAYAPSMLMPPAENNNSSLITNNSSLKYLGFAPWYDGSSAAFKFWSPEEFRDEDFKPLKYSGEEIRDARKIWGGQAFTGAEATEENFLKLAPGAKIIHLATHGQSDPRIGDYSWLAFAPRKDSLENELLFARELAPLQLSADLVILSACKTGVARFQKGEGLLGLPRAFVLAGAKAVLSTQWAVNDAASAALMQQFHHRLAQGKPKDVALQEAKKAFLKKHGSSAHPYFWSGFLLTGDASPIK